jgi:hypothetical protein
MSFTADQIYELLPAVYRTRDAQSGGPLQALLAVVAAQAAVCQDNLQQLYSDQFIETSAAWVVPYIGDLIGADLTYEIGGATGRRAVVANTIGYRRRKGTLLNLEQVAFDVSALPAVGVEFFKRLITTQSMRHLRTTNAATVNLRDGGGLDTIDSAFDALNRTISVRRIAPRLRQAGDPDATPLEINLHGGGRFNIPDVGVYLWRWKSRSVTNAPAFRVDRRRFRFSPLGHDIPLFNQPSPRASFSGLMSRQDVPQPIRRREFFDSIGTFYGPQAGLQLVADGVVIPASQICCRDLSDEPDGRWSCTAAGKIAIDPVLGRIQFASDLPEPAELRLDYNYGVPADIGAGSYARDCAPPTGHSFVVGTAQTPSLESAIAAWNQLPAGAAGIILLPNYESFDVDLTGVNAINIPSQSQLWILAARIHPDGTPGFDESCVTLRGNICVQGQQLPGSNGNTPPPGQLYVSGFWISGSAEILGDAVNVNLMDCTLVPGISLQPNGRPMAPGEPSIVVSAPGATLALLRCITGPIGINTGASARICSSIIDSCCPCSVAYAGPDLASNGADLHIEDSTVIGKVWARTMQLASNSVFLARRPLRDPWIAAIRCDRRQAGCVRFCYVPTDSITPKQFRCLPGDPSLDAALKPEFVTLQYGHPSYALFSVGVPMAVWTGADDGSQIGAYHAQQEAQAVRNVQLCAPEYIPIGLESGVFLVPSKTLVRPRERHAYGYGALPGTGCCDDQNADELTFVGIGAHLI